MAGYILYALGVVIIWSVLVYFARSGILKRSLLPLALLGVFITGSGGFLLHSQLRLLDEYNRMRTWKTTEGTIVKSEVVGERAFHPNIAYRYTVDGREYTGTSDLQLPGFGGRRSKYDAAEEIAQRYPDGSTVPVYYSPGDPSESRIVLSFPVELFLKIGLAGFLVLSGLGLGGYVLYRKRTGR